MILRRSIVIWTVALLVVVVPVAAPGLASAAPHKVIDARTGRALKVVRRGVISRSNANDAYVAVVELTTLPARGPILVVGKQRLVSTSWGSGYGQGAGGCSWEVDRATADAIARAWKVKRQDRAPLGTGLVARWRTKQATSAVGKPLAVVVAVENTGPTAVGLQLGGRHYGRDEHFAFTATRDGAAVPTIPLGPAAGGGAFQYQELAPGAKVEIEVDAAAWIAPSAPGTYVLEATYRSEVVPGTRGPSWPDRGAEIWDIELTGRVTLRVQ